MAIDASEVLRIARLAHLEYPASEDERLFDDAALGRYAADIDRILEHVRDLESVNVEGVERSAHGMPIPTRLRPDAADPALGTEKALAAAPAAEADAFRVPKVVE